MELTEKEKAILRVLQQRWEAFEKAIVANEKEIERLRAENQYYKAKKEGYIQAEDLIKSSIESIRTEL